MKFAKTLAKLRKKAITKRFSVTRTTLFPAAVTWLVPQGEGR